VKTQQRLHLEPDPRVRRSLAGAVLAAVVVGGSALGLVGLRVQEVHLAYRLDALRAEQTRTDTLIRQLEIEVATLRSPVRLEQRARRLGMAPPTAEQVRLAREYVTAGSGFAAANRGRVLALDPPHGTVSRQP
jgi:cell division protein FtsL